MVCACVCKHTRAHVWVCRHTCLHVCVHMWCVCLCVWLHLLMCHATHVEVSGQPQMPSLTFSLVCKGSKEDPLFFTALCEASCLASFWHFSYLHLLLPGRQDCTGITDTWAIASGILCGCQESELQLLNLHDRHFTSWAIYLAPALILMRNIHH